MKLILITLLIAQIYGAFSTNVPLAEQRGLMGIWDLLSPAAIPLAQTIDTAISTISNAHSTVSSAVSNAIYSLTSWIGDKIPPLGKRDLISDARSNLLNELQSFKSSFQQLIVEIFQSFLSGDILAQLRPLISKFNVFLQTHLQNIRTMITTLIPTMEGATATQAITSCLRLIQVIEEAMKNIHALFSS